MSQFLSSDSPPLSSTLVSTVHSSNKLFKRIQVAYPPSENSLTVKNPNTGLHVIDLPTDTPASTNEKIAKITAAQKPWAKLTNKQRAEIIRNFGAKIEESRADLAELLSVENGKPLAESTVEVGYGTNAANWFAGEAQREYGQVIPSAQPGHKWITTKEPVGPVSMITPWNFPSSMITRKAIPALAAGCTVVLKPAALTPLSAIGLKLIANDAGIPDDAFQIVLSAHGNVRAIGEAMTTNESIKAFSFTGSTGIGKKLLNQVSSNIRKSCMELGGLAPFIVTKSANLKLAVEGVLNGKFRGMGQVCIAPQRILVNEEVHDQFVEILKARMEEKLRFGRQEDKITTMGPLISMSGLENVASQVDDAVAKGATVVLGGNRVEELGPLYYEPTLLTGCNLDMKCWSEETFGPIIAVGKFTDEVEALELANKGWHGLAAYLYSNDQAQCWRLSEKIVTGMLGINEVAISTPEAPFGGVRESGLGREGGIYGLEAYTETKLINWNFN